MDISLADKYKYKMAIKQLFQRLLHEFHADPNLESQK